jgi:hypothetical protein
MLLSKLGGSWLLPPRDFALQLSVTLWITTAIHLDTPNIRLDPFRYSLRRGNEPDETAWCIGDGWWLSTAVPA